MPTRYLDVGVEAWGRAWGSELKPLAERVPWEAGIIQREGVECGHQKTGVET